jgi:hypothetical protein
MIRNKVLWSKKSLDAKAPGIFLCSETGEISNLDLIKDIDKIVKLLEVFPLEHQRK